MFRSGVLLSSSNIAVALLGLVRNVVIARLLSVEDFGIASTFAVTMALLEMAAYIGIDRLLVQARDGEARHLQATLHAMQAARGLVGAFVMFMIAEPVAFLFGIPEVAWAYQALAIVPLLRGLGHLDSSRYQREMNFLPSVIVQMTAQVLATVAAVAFAVVYGDFRAMLYTILVQQSLLTAMSHLVATRPYRWALDWDIARRAVAFGWPLLLNGFLVFGINHGDRIIVGSLLGMTELGWFSAAFIVAMVPSAVLQKTVGAFFLPQLARAQDDKIRYQQLSLVTLQATLFLGVLLAVSFSIIGPVLFLTLFGDKYAPALTVLVLLVIMQAFRLAKLGPIIVATAKAETKNAMVANSSRLLTLAIAWVTVSHGAGLQAVVTLGIIGEGFGLLIGLAMLRHKGICSLTGVVGACGTTFAILFLLYVQESYRATDVGTAWSLGVEDGLFLLAGFCLLWPMVALRAWLREVVYVRSS